MNDEKGKFYRYFSSEDLKLEVPLPTWLLLRRTLPHRSSQQPLQLWPVLPASELVSRAAELVEERSLVLRLEGGGSAWLIVYVWCDYVCGRIEFLENYRKFPGKLPLTIL